MKGIAMDSPLSSTLAEIYLQYFEEVIITHWIETNEIIYYKRYVDYIIIIFNQNKIKEESITRYMNNIHKHLEFKLTEEENKTINYSDLYIHRNYQNTTYNQIPIQTKKKKLITFTYQSPYT